jgi:hypothetical protein
MWPMMLANAALAGGPYEGCEAQTTGQLLTLRCDGFMVAVVEVVGSEMDAMGMLVGAFDCSAGIVVELPAEPEPIKAVTCGPTQAGWLLTSGWKTAPGASAAVLCVGQGASMLERCTPIVVDIAQHGPPELRPLMRDWVAPTLGDLALDVPRGCWTASVTDPHNDFVNHRIQCGLTFLEWIVTDNADGTDLPTLLQHTIDERRRATEANGTPLQVHDQPCTIAEQPALCARFVRPGHDPTDPPLDVVGYALLQDDQRVVATCRFPGGDPPALCEALFGWQVLAPAQAAPPTP